jgi:hypothetical protein
MSSNSTDIEKRKVVNRCNRLLRLIDFNAPRSICIAEAMLVLRSFTENGELDELADLVQTYVTAQKELNTVADAYEKDHKSELDEMFKELSEHHKDLLADTDEYPGENGGGLSS